MVTKDQITPGTKFSTPYEDNCTVVTQVDGLGCFVGIDSDGVKCTYFIEMVTKIHSKETNQ